jgi:hypothetical protein
MVRYKKQRLQALACVLALSKLENEASQDPLPRRIESSHERPFFLR